jgi:hypothetical protein
MEKLIELLNEYQKWKEKSGWTDDNFKWEKNYKWSISRYDEDDIREWENLYNDTAIAYLISKSFWFIQRLVEQNKIGISKSWIDELPAMYAYDYDSIECKTDRLLMILSIQDEPIRFLINILK